MAISKMKIKYLLLAGLSVLALSSCQKLFAPDRSGQAIMFSASSDEIQDAGTKTEYSGQVVSGKERINWVNGDQVKIFLHTHGSNNSNSAVESKDYYIVQIEANGQKSKARVASDNGMLTWKSNRTHDFYSLYPASGITSSNATFGNNNAKFTITLPEKQYGDLATNMQYAYMAAVSKGYSNSGKGSVVLDYYPMVTTLYVTITNRCQSRKPVDVRKVSLKHTKKFNNGASENEKRPYYLSGTYDLTATNGNFTYNPSNFRNGSTYVCAEFDDDTESLEYGQSMSCALFILPQNSLTASDLRLSILTTKSVMANTLANRAGISSFQAGKKYNVKVSIDEEDILVSDVEITPNSTQLVAKMLLEQVINFNNLTVAAVLDDVTHVYTGSGTCEIVNGQIKVRVDGDDGQYTWRDLTDAEVRYLASTVKEIDMTQSYFPPGTVLTVEDFALFANLEKINFLNLNNVTELDMSGMEKLQEVKFHHGGEIRISDCPSLTKLTLDNISGASLVHLENCPAMTQFNFTGNGAEQAGQTNFEFVNMQGLTSINMVTAKSITVDNCPNFATLTLSRPSSYLQAITLKDTPKFRTGNIGTRNQNFSERQTSLTFINCSNSVNSATFTMHYRNYSSPTVTKTNSNRVNVRYNQ